MKNLLRAFSPLMVISAACDDLYEENLPAKTVCTKQTEESIAEHKKAAEDKRKCKAEKLKRILKNEYLENKKRKSDY